MKLVSFRVQTPVGSFVRAGALHGHRVIDLNMACARLLADQHEARPARLANAMVPARMLELMEGGASAMARAGQALEHAISLGEAARGPEGETIVYRPEQVRDLAPLPNPTSLRDFIAFEEHIAATSKKRGQSIPPEWNKAPVDSKGDHRTIIGPEEDLQWPLETTKLDYELELACVIGLAG